jgi:transcriptional regulator with XRE-family HTH domain
MAREPESITAQRRALGRHLALFRQEAGLTQSQLAQQLPCDRTLVSHLERGRSRATEAEWAVLDRCCGAGGALTAAYHELEATVLEHERQARDTRLAQLRQRTGLRASAAVGVVDSATTEASAPDWDLDAVTQTMDSVTHADLSATQQQTRQAVPLAGSALTEILQGWLKPLGPKARVASGDAFTPPAVDAIEQLVAQLHDLARQNDGVLARKAVIAQLSELARLLREAPSGPLTIRVTVAAARLAQTAATMSWDARAHRAAQQYYLMAVQLAKLANDDALAAIAFAALGRQCFDLNRPDDGLEAVQLAQYGTRRTATPRLRAMLSTREAWAYALRGEVQAFYRAAGLAQDYFSETVQAEPCHWVRSFDLAELHGVLGARYRDLARHDPKHARIAQQHIQRAITLRDVHRVRNRAFDSIGLARAHLLAREPERAGAAISSALSVAGPWVPGRVGLKLADFYREAAPYTSVPAVREACKPSET